MCNEKIKWLYCILKSIKNHECKHIQNLYFSLPKFMTLISVPSALPCKNFQNGSEFESHCWSLPCISSHSGKTFALGREIERRADCSTWQCTGSNSILQSFPSLLIMTLYSSDECLYSPILELVLAWTKE